MKKILKHTCLFVILGLLFTVNSNAQSGKKALDIKAIKAMEGCFNVEFKYTETFSPEIDYEKAYDYTSAAFEWAEIIEETEDKIVLQHLLIINDSTIIKHWRQDWIYEAQRSFSYVKDNTWQFEKKNYKDVEGKWTQYVYQVDDSPRYSGTATWTHVDGVSSWRNKADSPLPRREYSKRSDYNVMKRGNSVQITDYGWLHEQDNDKIIREEPNTDQLLVQEKGYNTYEKRATEDCKSAQEWWKNNQEKWATVRDVWQDVLASHITLHLEDKVDGKKLYEHLFYGQGYEDKAAIEVLIDSYVTKHN